MGKCGVLVMNMQSKINTVFIVLLGCFVTFWTIIGLIGVSVEGSENFNINNSMIIAGLINISLLIIAWNFLSETIAKPIHKITNSINSISNGHLDTELNDIERDDEVGQIAKSIHALRNNSINEKKLEETAISERHKEKERQNFVETLLGSFKREMQNLIDISNRKVDSFRQTSDSLKRLNQEIEKNSGSDSTNTSSSMRSIKHIDSAAEHLDNLTNKLSDIVDTLLNGLHSDIENRRKAVRTYCDEEITVEINARNYPTSLVDKSDTGVRIISVDNLIVGENIIIHYKDGSQKIARCVWKNEHFAGFEFLVTAKMPVAA